jgi:hypothetical protein
MSFRNKKRLYWFTVTAGALAMVAYAWLLIVVGFQLEAVAGSLR